MLEWKNVCINVPNKNENIKAKYLNLVENLSGTCKQGELMAIMGPSGCGKTTFLGCLAGRMQKGSKTTGQITYNGEERDARKWLEMVGYVIQDDNIFEKLTVYDTLQYAAKFRLKNATKKIIKEKITEITDRFKISHVLKNRMEKLSGGERKRTMLAIELITDPEILFLDEPTSGLDTTTALTIIKMLKELANQGKTIVVTIHQPGIEIYSIFDRLLVMTDSKAIYFGIAAICEPFLAEKGIIKRETISFPDFLTELAMKETVTDSTSRYHKEVLALIEDNQAEKNKCNTLVTKNQDYRIFSIDFYKAFIIAGRQLHLEFINRYTFFKRLITHFLFIILINFFIVKGVSVSSILGDQLKGLKTIPASELQKILSKLDSFSSLSFIGLTSVLTTAYVTSALCFTIDVPAIKREVAAASYSTTTYFFGTFLSQVLLLIQWPVICSILVVYYYENHNFYIVGLLFGMFFSYILFGLCIGAIIPGKILQNVIMCLLASLLIVFGFSSLALTGVFAKLGKYVWSKKFANFTWVNVFLPFNGLILVPNRIINGYFNEMIKDIARKYTSGAEKSAVITAYLRNDEKTWVISRTFSLTHFSMITFLGLFLFILLALYIHAARFMPQIRMKLGN